MKVTNKTNKELKIQITDKGGMLYSVYLQANNSVDLEPWQLTDDIFDKVESKILDCDTGLVRPTKTVTEEMPVVVDQVPVVDGDDTSDGEDQTPPVEQDQTPVAQIQDPEVTAAPEDKVPEEGQANENQDQVQGDNVQTEGQEGNSDDEQDPGEQESATGEIFKCELCDREFASERGLQMHMDRSHPNE